MKKINLENYNIEGIDEKGSKAKIPYDVKNSIVHIIMHHSLGLTGWDIYQRGELSSKIKKSNGEILLENDDFNIIESAFKTVAGLGENEEKLCKRIFEAETIKVKEDKKI